MKQYKVIKINDIEVLETELNQMVLDYPDYWVRQIFEIEKGFYLILQLRKDSYGKKDKNKRDNVDDD